jgi:uncharacterized protein Yka (UPF0111/DUF47 family)
MEDKCPKCGEVSLFDRTGLVGSDVTMECCCRCKRVWNSDQQEEIDRKAERIKDLEHERDRYRTSLNFLSKQVLK